MSGIKSFRIDTSEKEIDYLKTRLANARFPEQESVDDWNQGVPLAYAKELVNYWLNDYDWFAQQEKLNRFPQYKLNIEGLDIHFIHATSPHPNARGLILTHGWPSSIVEFQKVIEPLIDPPNGEDAFHVVCPSLPGFGYSQKPETTGWDVQKIASVWDALMIALGYQSYFAQGGDWGAAVTTAIAAQNKGACKGIHLNSALAPPTKECMEKPSEEDLKAFGAGQFYKQWDSGYMKQQSTRPQTLGYGLSDSPVGQAMWILEKFYQWSDCNGNLENVYSKDELLNNIMYYWLPCTSASSAKLYWENYNKPFIGAGSDAIKIPTAVSNFPKEILYTPKSWAAQRYENIIYWRELDKGGHFPAFEQPELFVEELRSAFREM